MSLVLFMPSITLACAQAASTAGKCGPPPWRPARPAAVWRHKTSRRFVGVRIRKGVSKLFAKEPIGRRGQATDVLP